MPRTNVPSGGEFTGLEIGRKIGGKNKNWERAGEIMGRVWEGPLIDADPR